MTGTNRVRGTSSRLAPGEALDRRPHGALQLDHRRRVRVAGSTVLRLTIRGSSSTPCECSSVLGQSAQIDPQVVGVVVAPAPEVAKRFLVLGRGLGRFAQDELTIRAAPGDVTALAVGLGALHDLHQKRDLLPTPGERRSGGQAARRGCRSWRSSRSGNPARAARRASPSGAARRRRRRDRADTTPGPGAFGQLTGARRIRLELGDHALHEVRARCPRGRSPGRLPERFSVAARVASLFISTSGRRTPWRSRRARVWPTMMSRNDRPSRACDQRLGLLQPHRGGQSAVELDYRDVLESLQHVGIGQILERGHVPGRLKLGRREHRLATRTQPGVGALKGPDRLLVRTRRAHLFGRLRRNPSFSFP